MDFETVKTNFENTIERMRADLISYANRPSSNPKAVETRTQNINNLVEYYNRSESSRSELEMAQMSAHFAWSKLHTETQKLVLFCKLHRVNPSLIFYYTLEELLEIYNAGVRFTPPQRSIDKLMVVPKGLKGYELLYKNDSLEDDALMAKYEEKYYSLLAASGRMRPANNTYDLNFLFGKNA